MDTRIALAVVVVGFGSVVLSQSGKAAAAPPTTRPPVSAVAGVPPQGAVVAAIPLPDITMRIETDGSIAIENIGDADVTKEFLVQINCKPKGTFSPLPACGQPFDAAGLWLRMVKMPAGHGNAPLKKNPGMVLYTDSGPGWVMLYPPIPSWPKGTFTLSGCANQDPPDPARRIREKTRNNNCAFRDVVNP